MDVFYLNPSLMGGKIKCLLVVLSMVALHPLSAGEIPRGILIARSSSSLPNAQAQVLEYRSIDEQLIPPTNFITVHKSDGHPDIVRKEFIVQKVEYPAPDAFASISNDLQANRLTQTIQQLQAIASQYGQAHQFLDPVIAGLQAEISRYRQGMRKISGQWVSVQEYARLVADENGRVTTAEANRIAQVQAEEERQRRAMAEANTRRQEEDLTQRRKIEAASPAQLHPAFPTRQVNESVSRTYPPIQDRQAQTLVDGFLAQLMSMVLRFLVPIGAIGMVIAALSKKKSKTSRRWSNTAPALPRVENWQPPSSEPEIPPQVPCALTDLHWEQFEILVGEIYRRKGYTVELSSGTGSDGGIDLKLTRADEVVLIQCKHWKVYKVGVKEIREFFRVLTAEGVKKGIFVTTGKYTKDARDFAEGKPIDLLEREDIDLLVSEVARPNESIFDLNTWIDEFIGGSRIVDPDCPYCRRPMALRKSRQGLQFWGCSAYPGCRGKRDARNDLLRHLAYQPR